MLASQEPGPQRPAIKAEHDGDEEKREAEEQSRALRCYCFWSQRLAVLAPCLELSYAIRPGWCPVHSLSFLTCAQENASERAP